MQYAIEAPGAARAIITDGINGTTLATIPINDGGPAVAFVDSNDPWVTLYDSAGSVLACRSIVPGTNYFRLTVAIDEGSADPLYPPDVREYGGLMELAGRLTSLSGNPTTILHVAAGYRPAQDVSGQAVAAGTTLVPFTLKATGEVLMNSYSATALGLSARWVQ